MTHWSIHITGDEFDLAELAQCFTSPELSIKKEESAYVLQSMELDSIEHADEALERAHELINLVSGAARLTIHAQRPLSVGNVAQRIENGIEKVSVVLKDEVMVRDSITVTLISNDGTVETHRSSDATPMLVSAASKNPQMARALRLYGRPLLDWRNLFCVYEIIEHASGGEKGLVQKGWAARNQIERFTRTANHPAAAGFDARHGVQSADPPSNPMTISEAREFVGSLLRRSLSAIES